MGTGSWPQGRRRGGTSDGGPAPPAAERGRHCLGQAAPLAQRLLPDVARSPPGPPQAAREQQLDARFRLAQPSARSTAAMPASATQVRHREGPHLHDQLLGRLALQPAAQPQLGDGDEAPDDQDDRADHVQQPQEDVVGPPVAEQHARRSRRRTETQHGAARHAADDLAQRPSGPGRGRPASRPCARSRRCWRSSRRAARPARPRS